MAALASCWAFWASAALSWASRTLEFSSFCLDCIWLFWASSSAFFALELGAFLFQHSLIVLERLFGVLHVVEDLGVFDGISCITSLNVSSSYRSFTEASMATLPPSRSSCMAAMCCLKAPPLVGDLRFFFGDLLLLGGDLLFLQADAVLHLGNLAPSAR